MEVERDTVYGSIRCFSPVILGPSNMSVGEPSTSNTVSSLMPEPQLCNPNFFTKLYYFATDNYVFLVFFS